MSAHEPVDEDLWFTCSLDPTERDYLVGNAHTFLGRISAYCRRKQGSPYYYVSASEILDNCSDESRRWVQGFLAGQEPTPRRMNRATTCRSTTRKRNAGGRRLESGQQLGVGQTRSKAATAPAAPAGSGQQVRQRCSRTE